MTSSEATREPLSFAVRLLSGVAGVVVFLLGFVLSFGAIVAAPVGLWLVQRRARRVGRPASRIAALVGSVAGSMVLAIALWSLLFALIPKPSTAEFQKAQAAAQSRHPMKLPDWYTKAFPQVARADSANRAMVQSPSFIRISLILGALFAGGFFGAIGGTLGWCGATLVGMAVSSGRASQSAPGI